MVQTWYNSDGLLLKYGTTKVVAGIGGEAYTYPRVRQLEFKIDLTALTELETPIDDNIFFPTGVRIQEVEVVAHTVAATGVAIDLGLISTDRSTQIDYDGLLAAVPTANMDLAGEKNIYSAGTTYAGALIGTSTSSKGYITCSRTTATAFTTGLVYVTIRYYVP